MYMLVTKIFVTLYLCCVLFQKVSNSQKLQMWNFVLKFKKCTLRVGTCEIHHNNDAMGNTFVYKKAEYCWRMAYLVDYAPVYLLQMSIEFNKMIVLNIKLGFIKLQIFDLVHLSHHKSFEHAQRMLQPTKMYVNRPIATLPSCQGPHLEMRGGLWLR